MAGGAISPVDGFAGSLSSLCDRGREHARHGERKCEHLSPEPRHGFLPFVWPHYGTASSADKSPGPIRVPKCPGFWTYRSARDKNGVGIIDGGRQYASLHFNRVGLARRPVRCERNLGPDSSHGTNGKCRPRKAV